MNKYQLTTHGLRRWVNQIVDATVTSPSLAEMVCHHVDTHWGRVASRMVYFRIEDPVEIYLHLEIVDARGYTDTLYERGRALMGVGVNGALMSPSDEASLEQCFPHQVFRICPYCGAACQRWFDYFGHVHLDHFPLGL